MRRLGALVDVAAVVAVGCEGVAARALAPEGTHSVATYAVATHHATFATLVYVYNIEVTTMHCLEKVRHLEN